MMMMMMMMMVMMMIMTVTMMMTTTITTTIMMMMVMMMKTTITTTIMMMMIVMNFLARDKSAKRPLLLTRSLKVNYCGVHANTPHWLTLALTADGDVPLGMCTQRSAPDSPSPLSSQHVVRARGAGE
ncbi:hypothetical protein ElyMa_001641100 [Elysia marginata]|uniref:Uncharacterized protein n=1 Tax=Elysia marginata TaxID=1093978 RepID=A0AAV4JSB5_9GAST|nr:hypothetical protein ElyMa_001641100 [Elysia marginata]